MVQGNELVNNIKLSETEHFFAAENQVVLDYSTLLYYEIFQSPDNISIRLLSLLENHLLCKVVAFENEKYLLAVNESSRNVTYNLQNFGKHYLFLSRISS